ncbi:MAG: hypothetical protein IIW33_02905, partial [Oscillospiraceae bacterium]|nr:hypothetical protein [Oscillospiraceae bacterium]
IYMRFIGKNSHKNPLFCKRCADFWLPLTRELDFAKQKTEGEKFFISVSPSVKTFGFATSLVRGRRTKTVI